MSLINYYTINKSPNSSKPIQRVTIFCQRYSAKMRKITNHKKLSYRHKINKSIPKPKAQKFQNNTNE